MPQSSFSFLSGSSVCSPQGISCISIARKEAFIFMVEHVFEKVRTDVILILWFLSQLLDWELATCWQLTLEFNGPCSSSSLAQHIRLPDLSSWSDTSYPKIPRLCREFWRHVESKDWKKKKNPLHNLPKSNRFKKKNERSDTWVIHSCLHFTVEETEAQRDRRLS